MKAWKTKGPATEMARLRTAIDKAARERDEWRAKALDIERHPAVVVLRAERDAAVADNAALTRLAWAAERAWTASGDLNHAGFNATMLELRRVLQTQPHPGVALLERHRKDLEAARYADDNVKAFAEAFCSTVEEAEQRANAPSGGQSVPDHGDFAHVQPSTRGQLRRWAQCGRAALKGERSQLLVRARNEGLEKAVSLLRERAAAMVGFTARSPVKVVSALAAEANALKEPEE